MKVKCDLKFSRQFIYWIEDTRQQVIEGLLENDEPISKEEFTNHCLSDYALILGCEYTYDDYLEEFEETNNQYCNKCHKVEFRWVDDLKQQQAYCCCGDEE